MAVLIIALNFRIRFDNFSFLFQARIMTKKFILPFLLGLKFNLATLLPLILGAIILISKKAALLSKLAIFISTFFGIGGIASLAGLSGGLGGGLGGGFGGGFGGGYGGGHISPGYGFYGKDPSVHHHVEAYKVLENTPRTQEETVDHFYDYDKKHLLKDRSSRLYERESDTQAKHMKYTPSNQRNFVWATGNPNQ